MDCVLLFVVALCFLVMNEIFCGDRKDWRKEKEEFIWFICAFLWWKFFRFFDGFWFDFDESELDDLVKTMSAVEWKINGGFQSSLKSDRPTSFCNSFFRSNVPFDLSFYNKISSIYSQIKRLSYSYDKEEGKVFVYF